MRARLGPPPTVAERWMTVSDDVSVHPAGICEADAVGAGTRIWAFAHVLPGAVIGRDCNICDHVFIENDVILGRSGDRQIGCPALGWRPARQRRLRGSECHLLKRQVPKEPAAPGGVRADDRTERRLDRGECHDPARTDHRLERDGRRGRRCDQGRPGECDRLRESRKDRRLRERRSSKSGRPRRTRIRPPAMCAIWQAELD